MSELKEIPIVQETAEQNKEALEKMGFKFEEDKKLTNDEILEYTIKKLKIDPESTKYNYNDAVDMLRKFLFGILNIQDLITPADIFDLFLLRFKADILGEPVEF